MLYRLYFLDPDDHIFGRHDFEADSDGDAVQQAAALAVRLDGALVAVELWQAARRVRRLQGELSRA
jgi:hypothetical protein